MTDADFYASLPAFDAFAAVVDPSRYRRVPPSWWVGITDVVGPNRAIEQGRYSPTLELAFQISRAFGVPLDDVFQYPES